MAKTRGKKVAPKAGPKARLDFETPAVSEEPSPTKVVKKPSAKPKGKAASEAAASSKLSKKTPPEQEPTPEVEATEESFATPTQTEQLDDEATTEGMQEEEATEAPAPKPKKRAEKKKAKKPVKVPTLMPSVEIEDLEEEEEGEEVEGREEAEDEGDRDTDLDKYLTEIEDIEVEPQPEKILLFEEEEEAPADIKKRALEKAKGKRKVVEPTPEPIEPEVSQQRDTDEEKERQEPSVPSQAQAGSEEPSEDSSPKRRVGKSVGMKARAKLAGEASSQKRKAEEGISAPMPKRGRGVGSPTPSKPSSGRPPVRGIINSKGVHRETLAALGIEQEVRDLFSAIGWKCFLDMECVIFPSLSRDFVHNLKIKAVNKPATSTRVLTFKLIGRNYFVSADDLNMLLGIVTYLDLQEEEYVDAVTVVPDSAEGVDAKWVDIGDGSIFQSGSTKGYCLNNDALRFCHMVLAYNFFSRKDSSNSITNQELYIFWCMVHKIKINFGSVAIAHFREIKTHPRHHISCTQLITQIAVRYRLLDLHETDLTPLPREYFDLNYLRRMQDVVDDEDGKPVFFVPGANPSSMLLAIAGTSKKPPAGKALQREHPVAVITRRLELIENAQFQTNEKLTRIEAGLKAFFKHVGFSYPTPATD
ncbi:hypothetical protein C2S51_025111 [Perilla frutescens var. frutescens]|nr:hypothetical protein C2S51_025111 [Perilla frutescens var. frutescens]